MVKCPPLSQLLQAEVMFCGAVGYMHVHLLKAHLSSKRVSPPRRAPRNTPSGRRASLICTRTPGRSLTQCKLMQDTIASCEFLGMTSRSRSSSACIRSTSTK